MIVRKNNTKCGHLAFFLHSSGKTFKMLSSADIHVEHPFLD